MTTEPLSVTRMTCTRLPTDVGEFRLCLYHNNRDNKENLALVVGDLEGHADVLVRVHSECFTGDVLGSLRCDCGPQLAEAMRRVALEGRGVILYLRQEGRGIGLLDKLRAYNLQDKGYDTVDANLMLGHQPDLRDYGVAALMLRDLGVNSIRLLTNNPDKIASLEQYGIAVSERVPLQIGMTAENAAYLSTKVRRMRHLLQLEQDEGDAAAPVPATAGSPRTRPFVTLSYAQSLDGCIAERPGERLTISGPEAMRYTHQLRAHHDAILVGIGTVLIDDPQLTVRYVEGSHPQPIVLDSGLRFPSEARLLRGPRPPWIATSQTADPARQAALEAAGARVVRFPTAGGRVELPAVLAWLQQEGIDSVMVEGGAEIIRSFLTGRLADRLIVTIAPMLLGGVPAISHNSNPGSTALPQLSRPQTIMRGRDIILIGEPVWHD